VADSAAHPENRLETLPDAEVEANAVAALFRNPTILRRNSATQAQLLRELPNADLFHFSGHGLSGIGSSALVLNGGTSDLLTAATLETGDFKRTRLAVLSACSTASGTGRSFTDSESLARTLISSGVPQVVASRWYVDSGSTLYLMKVFYQNLRGGESVVESLRNSEKTLRKDGCWDHPFYWAPFAVFGKPSST